MTFQESLAREAPQLLTEKIQIRVTEGLRRRVFAMCLDLDVLPSELLRAVMNDMVEQWMEGKDIEPQWNERVREGIRGEREERMNERAYYSRKGGNHVSQD